MAADLIVSYDGTANDDDALALGRILAQTGASLALAYVRHSREFDPRREEVASHDAQRRLDLGAAWLGDPELPRHVVISASTGEGLAQLAVAEQASVIVFGSDFRTAPGHAEPGTSAQHLLEGGPVAVAVARAGLRARAQAAIDNVALWAPDGDPAANETAQALAGKLDARLVTSDDPDVDLIVVGSQPGAPEGHVALGGSTRAMLDASRSSVLVVARGRPVLL